MWRVHTGAFKQAAQPIASWFPPNADSAVGQVQALAGPPHFVHDDHDEKPFKTIIPSSNGGL
jgi:hypothetical protein